MRSIGEVYFIGNQYNLSKSSTRAVTFYSPTLGLHGVPHSPYFGIHSQSMTEKMSTLSTFQACVARDDSHQFEEPRANIRDAMVDKYVTEEIRPMVFSKAESSGQAVGRFPKLSKTLSNEISSSGLEDACMIYTAGFCWQWSNSNEA